MKSLVTRGLVAVLALCLVLGGSVALAQATGGEGKDPKVLADELYAKAKKLADDGKYVEAKLTVEEALKLSPDHAAAKELLAKVAPLVPVGKEEEYLKKLLEEVKVQRKYETLVADNFFETARKRFDERRYEDAEKNLEQALVANPNHAGARELLAKVRSVLGKDVEGRRDILERSKLEQDVYLGFAVAELRKTVADAKLLVKEDKHDAALEKLGAARNSAKVLARRLDVGREQAEIETLIDQVSQARDKAKKEADQRKLEEARKLAEAERARGEDLQKQRVDRLFEDARELYKDNRFLLAAKKAEEILRIDPRNKEVAGFRDKCYEVQVADDWATYRKTMKLETDETWRSVRKLAIPFTQVQPLYPDDWEEKRRRTAGIQIEQESPEETKWKKELQTALEEPVSFDFVATPLDDVVAFLRSLRRVNIVVDKQAVAGRGALEVTLKLDKLPLKDALDWILRLLDLRYTLEGGAIYISTKEKIGLGKKTVTRYYDVTDLTVEIRNFKPNVAAISNPGDEGENLPDIFKDEEEAGKKAGGETFTGESLVEFIKSVIAPGTWDEIGGAAKAAPP